MSIIIKTYVGIFLLFLSAFSMISICSATMDANQARDYHSGVLTQIGDANFAPSVINACKSQAEENGYELVISQDSIVVDEDGKPTLMEVILRYDYEIGFFGVSSPQQIRGFAR